MPSSAAQKNVVSRSIVDVILIKSIENIYVAPILKENFLKTQVNNSLILS